MVTVEDAARLAEELPEVTVGVQRDMRTWLVAGKAFAWERPFTKADIKRYGAQPVPEGPILAVRVGDLDEKDAILSVDRAGFFTISHFDGYPAVLIQLLEVEPEELRVAIVAAWRSMAPRKLAEAHEARR